MERYKIMLYFACVHYGVGEMGAVNRTEFIFLSGTLMLSLML